MMLQRDSVGKGAKAVPYGVKTVLCLGQLCIVLLFTSCISDMRPCTMQGMAEFLMHGKHFAAGQGRGHFADVEVLDLKGMYAAAHKPQSVIELLNKVRVLHISL